MKQYLSAIALAAVLVGCGVSPVQKLAEHNIIVENNKIMDDFKIVNVTSKTRKDGLIEAQAVLKNNTEKNKFLSYKMDWSDKDGFVRDSILSKWKTVQVEANRNVVIYGISPSMDAKDFKIRINYPSKQDKLKKDSAHYEYQGK